MIRASVSVWFRGFIGERRGENILNLLCLVQFLKGEGRERKRSKIPHKLIYCSPKLECFLEGRKREMS